MLKVFKNLKELDSAVVLRYEIAEEILMENAARGVRDFLLEKGLIGKKTLIVVGGGNNGADGLALARMIHNAAVFSALPPKSELALLQTKRAEKLDISFVQSVGGYEVIIDALLGSGQTKPLENELKNLIKTINAEPCIKIALDIPSGVMDGMSGVDVAFKADFTVTLGAYKEALLGDYAKDFVGETVLKDLGLLDEKYTQRFAPSAYLLEKTDLKLPKRAKKNCNKGDFGHLCIVGGEMIGAATIAAKAALRFGVGLVTLTARDTLISEPQIMMQNSIPKTANTLLIGQGLGDAYSQTEIVQFVMNIDRCVVDADIFKKECVKEILALNKKMVLTPHPKEFSSLLKIALNIDVSVDEIQKDRFGFARLFCQKFENKTLVLKGANTLIAENDKLFVMPYGSAALAKGGSGDALAGVIASLLAQGYEPLEAAKNGSLALALAAANYKGADYSMTIDDLLDGLKWL